jgi:two-component sensor histidine kinase
MSDLDLQPAGRDLADAKSSSTLHWTEADRMAAVRRYDILDTPSDGAFDRITAIAARRLKVPIAIISIVDDDRIWFKSRHGVEVEQIGRDPGLCASAILSSGPYILPDARLDLRALANPLVAGEFGLRFYAGVPLRTSDGHNLGTLCVIDMSPRSVDQDQIDELKDLAALVMDQLELRLSARQAVAQARLMAREIDHRVMNSLQFVSSLLTLQSRGLDACEAKRQLQNAARRVGAVARVHRHCYAHDAEEISCLDFLRRLCADLSGITGRPVMVGGDQGDVPTTWIQPIGLIVNELVTNAAKHAEGRIEVAYTIARGRHEVRVCDEGPGVPAGFDPEASQGLGMKVIKSLARQLGGRLSVVSGPKRRGSCFSVAFPLDDSEPSRAASLASS